MFIRAEERYKLQWGSDTKVIKGFEIPVPMPIMPDERLIKNHDKASKNQKYVSEELDYSKLSKIELEEFAAAQWHRRMNGEWVLIKGEPYYIPGGAIYFFDNWVLESGLRAEFRYSALKLFWAWYNYVERAENVFGLYNLKTRRIGDTANFLSILTERTTRFKGVQGGLQSYNDTIAKKTFARAAKAMRKMPYYYKPNRTGSDAEFMAFMNRAELISMKAIKDKNKIKSNDLEEVLEFLGSFMDYQSTVEGAYDGGQLLTAFMDEIIKIPVFRMNAITQFKNLRRVVSLFAEDYIYGKIIASSTVEKRDTADPDQKSSVDVAEWFWENSDPVQIEENDDDRTNSGLVRIFRGYEDAAKPDEYGFPQVKRAQRLRQIRVEKALKSGDMESLYDIYRKEPGTPEEALIEDNSKCPLYPQICQIALKHLRQGLDRWGEPIPDYRSPYVPGRLEWLNGNRNTKVIFIPDPDGPWHVSQLPDVQNNVRPRAIKVRDEMNREKEVITFIPENAPFFRIGSDPISSNPKIITKGSRMAITVKRRYYLPHESRKLKFDTNGIILNPEDMITGQPVADYSGRPSHPNLAFDEIVKACFFWGAPAMIEMDKYEAYAYMIEHGYHGFIMVEPANISAKRGRKKNPAPGVRSSGDIVGMYVTALKTMIYHYWPCIKHPRLLKSASRFITDKRTKFDETVSWGMSEIGDMDHRYRLKEATKGWATDPFKI